MGVTTRNRKPGDHEAGPAPQPTHAPRDADALAEDEGPFLAPVADESGQAAAFHVVFAQDVIDDIRAHGRASPDVEVCGVLVGNVYHDDDGSGCYVAANIRGNGAEGRNAQVTFTSDTWAHINTMMDTKYTDERIVGWYHTHPGFGIFLSEMDLFIHKNFFAEPWQIAYVDDPIGGDRGVFVWENGCAVRRPHLIEAADDGAESRQGTAGDHKPWWRKLAVPAALVLLLLGLLAAALMYKGIR